MRYYEIIGKTKVKENASSGATGAASVATVVGGLGAGFDPKGHKGIYQNSKPVVIKRVIETSDDKEDDKL